MYYRTIRQSYLLLNQNQVYVPILLSTKRRKKVFPRIHAIQYQDIFNNIIAQSDGLFKALFWNTYVQRIVYHYLGEFNLNSQAIPSNNFIILTSATSAHSDSDPISENYINKVLFLQAYLTYSETTIIITTQVLSSHLSIPTSLILELLNSTIHYLAI